MSTADEQRKFLWHGAALDRFERDQSADLQHRSPEVIDSYRSFYIEGFMKGAKFERERNLVSVEGDQGPYRKEGESP